jgi:adenosylhomocysteine nucleosidase
MTATTQATRVGVITGLIKEADCLRPRRGGRAPAMVFAAAGQPALAAQAAEQMLAEGASGLISFGIAGGLDPSLGPGVAIVAERVLDGDRRDFACDEAWVARLMLAEGAHDSGPILGTDRPVMTVEDKRRLHRRTGALAVDMESHAVAEVADRAGVPFVAIRAIGDPASRAIPRAALAGLGPDGRTRALPVLAALLRRPGDFRAIWRLAQDTNRALAALRRLGPQIGTLAE